MVLYFFLEATPIKVLLFAEYYYSDKILKFSILHFMKVFCN